MSRPLHIVALDLATATGIAHTHDSAGNERLAVRTVNAGLLPLHPKVARIEQAVRRACGVPEAGGNPAAGTKPDLVVIEGTFSGHGPADYPLHAMHANVKQWLYRQAIPYVDVSPATLKVWATGSGATQGENKVTKQDVCEAIVAAYGALLAINIRDDNACDAVALLSLALAAYGQPLAEVDRRNKRALNVPVWPTLGGE